MSITEWDCFGEGEMYPVKHSGKWVRKSDCDALAARLAEQGDVISQLRIDLAEAERLMDKAISNLRYASRCMNPSTPAARWWNETAAELDAFLRPADSAPAVR